MKVNKSKSGDALISILDQIFDDNAVREIQKNLNKLANGASISKSEVDKIFGNWANDTPKDTDHAHKAIKIICAYIKEQMFKF